VADPVVPSGQPEPALPAVASEVEAGGDLHLYFPVEIEVRTAPPELDARQVAEMVMSELAEGVVAAADGVGAA
jgi:hypothetical protein